MSGGGVVWAEVPDEDGSVEGAEAEAHGDVDDSFAVRRLRRWIKGMFGGAGKRPVRESGPVEGDRGNREAPPTEGD